MQFAGSMCQMLLIGKKAGEAVYNVLGLQEWSFISYLDVKCLPLIMEADDMNLHQVIL